MWVRVVQLYQRGALRSPSEVKKDKGQSGWLTVARSSAGTLVASLEVIAPNGVRTRIAAPADLQDVCIEAMNDTGYRLRGLQSTELVAEYGNVQQEWWVRESDEEPRGGPKAQAPKAEGESSKAPR